MNKELKSTITLVTIAIISALSIALMAQYAYPRIDTHRVEALKKAIFIVLPDAQRYEVIDENVGLYRGMAANGKIVGYAFVGQGTGYQGAITIMIGASPDWATLQGITVLANVETPGLGSKIGDVEFGRQFAGLPLSLPIEYILNLPPQLPNQVQGITGATISTRSVVSIVNKKIKEAKSAYDNIKK